MIGHIYYTVIYVILLCMLYMLYILYFYICLYIFIQIYSGITCGRVLNRARKSERNLHETVCGQMQIT